MSCFQCQTLRSITTDTNDDKEKWKFEFEMGIEMGIEIRNEIRIGIEGIGIEMGIEIESTLKYFNLDSGIINQGQIVQGV
jgi:non-canonical (house-cleaning) NTP pyrophosphatase